jgi:hypothetical protein
LHIKFNHYKKAIVIGQAHQRQRMQGWPSDKQVAGEGHMQCCQSLPFLWWRRPRLEEYSFPRRERRHRRLHEHH